MRKYYVYILRCRDGSYYTGVTRNVSRRVWEHQKGLIEGSYTHGRRPVKLVFTESFSKAVEAIEAEKKIKGWSREKKEALIAGRYEDLPGLSRSKKK